MRILLDTHTFLWWDNDELPLLLTQRIQRAEEVFVSAASAWEITIKSALGKIKATVPLSLAITDYGFLELPISMAHAEAVRALPFIHKDPFDRLLIAQAQLEGLTLVTDDRMIGKYRVSTMWAGK